MPMGVFYLFHFFFLYFSCCGSIRNCGINAMFKWMLHMYGKEFPCMCMLKCVGGLQCCCRYWLMALLYLGSSFANHKYNKNNNNNNIYIHQHQFQCTFLLEIFIDMNLKLFAMRQFLRLLLFFYLQHLHIFPFGIEINVHI